mgnify:CR=1 FL=1
MTSNSDGDNNSPEPVPIVDDEDEDDDCDSSLSCDGGATFNMSGAFALVFGCSLLLLPVLDPNFMTGEVTCSEACT